ncbi:MAG: hypothetical protein DSY34_02955 [Desulfurobacterium sp.]|nr:MAG: hypothetical protein DSY34_02955 [Desulfurobacterium sp.]
MPGVLSVLILLSLFAVLVTTLAMGGNPELFFEISSILFVIVGTFAAGLASLPFDVIGRIVTPVSRAIVDRRIDMLEFIDFLNELSIAFRKEGLFGLERVVNSRRVPYPGIKRAVQLAMEISDVKQIKEIFEIEHILRI